MAHLLHSLGKFAEELGAIARLQQGFKMEKLAFDGPTLIRRLGNEAAKLFEIAHIAHFLRFLGFFHVLPLMLFQLADLLLVERQGTLNADILLNFTLPLGFEEFFEHGVEW